MACRRALSKDLRSILSDSFVYFTSSTGNNKSFITTDARLAAMAIGSYDKLSAVQQGSKLSPSLPFGATDTPLWKPDVYSSQIHTILHAYRSNNRRRLYSTESRSSTDEIQGKGGWSKDAVINWPNGLSMMRLLSGPAIGYLILHDHVSIAVPALVISAATDWLDGYLARRQGLTNNVLGSYLDPLADKILVGSVVISMGYSGLLPPYLFGVIIGRDAFLIGGAFLARGKALGWTWPGAREFFNISGSTTNEPSSLPAPKVEPLYISKVNTVLQIALISSCLTDAWLGWPGSDINVYVLGPGTAFTTVWSCLAYIHAYRNGTIRLS